MNIDEKLESLLNQYCILDKYDILVLEKEKELPLEDFYKYEHTLFLNNNRLFFNKGDKDYEQILPENDRYITELDPEENCTKLKIKKYYSKNNKIEEKKKYKKCHGCGRDYDKCGCLGGGPDEYYTWSFKNK